MNDLSNELTVFFITTDNDPNSEMCLDALKNQNCKFKLDVIKNYYPLSLAFQQMLLRCKTKYFIQCDSDMLLHWDAVEIMYNYILKSDVSEAMWCFPLTDAHLKMPIIGIKIYKNEIFQKYPFNLQHSSCEVEQLDRLKKDGYTYGTSEEIMGEHSVLWTDEGIFERYFNLMQKFRIYHYSWISKLPEKLMQIYKTNSTKQNFYAVAGLLSGMFTDDIIVEEKDVRNKRKSFSRLRSFLETPTSATLYLNNRCNFKCQFCRRQTGTLEDFPDMKPELVHTLLNKFPTITGACLCFTEDTKIRLVDGTSKTFKELEEIWNKEQKSFWVYSRDGNNKIIPTLAENPRKTQKINELIEITLDNNKIIKCTLNHKFRLKDGSYKEAKDLEKTDSLSALYIGYNRLGNTRSIKYEYIFDGQNDGFTHRIFAKHYFKNIDNLVVHHKNENNLDNTKENLELLTSGEHISLHANSAKSRERFEKNKKKWNDSNEGKKHIANHNRSQKMRQLASQRMKEYHKTDRAKENRMKLCDPENIKKGQQSKIIKIIKKLLLKNLDFNEKNYNRNRESRVPLYNTILKYFKSYEEALQISTYNHKIISKKILKLKTPIWMYCLTVPETSNFALDAGVFVSNCGYGETLLSPNLLEIISAIKQHKNKCIGLISNGSLLKQRLPELISNPPSYISVSLNASNAEDHERITQTKTWDDVIEGIKASVASPIPTYVSAVITTENLNDIPNIIKLVYSLGVKTLYLHNVLPAEDHVSDEENFWRLVLQKEHESIIEEFKKIPESSIVAKWPVLIDKTGGTWDCQFPWKSIAIDGAGSVSICNSVLPCHSKNGNINDASLLQNDYCMRFRDSFCKKDTTLPCIKCFRNWRFM